MKTNTTELDRLIEEFEDKFENTYLNSQYEDKYTGVLKYFGDGIIAFLRKAYAQGYESGQRDKIHEVKEGVLWIETGGSSIVAKVLREVQDLPSLQLPINEKKDE